MTESLHSAAPHHLPFFITAPAETDVLLVAMLVILLVIALILGNLYFKLHALPEHIAHKSNPGQMQLVAVLALLALFTHNNFFWIAALLLAFLQLPDVSSPVNSIARSLEKLAAGSVPATGSQPSIPAPLIDAEPAPTSARSPGRDVGRAPNASRATITIVRERRDDVAGEDPGHA